MKRFSGDAKQKIRREIGLFESEIQIHNFSSAFFSLSLLFSLVLSYPSPSLLPSPSSSYSPLPWSVLLAQTATFWLGTLLISVLLVCNWLLLTDHYLVAWPGWTTGGRASERKSRQSLRIQMHSKPFDVKGIQMRWKAFEANSKAFRAIERHFFWARLSAESSSPMPAVASLEHQIDWGPFRWVQQPG